MLLITYNMGAQNNMEIIWQSCFGGSNNEEKSVSIVENGDGYFVLSTTKSVDGDISCTNIYPDNETSIWLTAVDSLGKIKWDKCYGYWRDPDKASNIIAGKYGNYYIGGSSNTFQSSLDGNRNLIKIDENGEIIWKKEFGGVGNDYPGHLLLLNNGNILIYGPTSASSGHFIPVHYGNRDVWLLEINYYTGAIVNNTVLGNSDINDNFDIIQTSDNGFLLTSSASSDEGMVVGEPRGRCDLWIVKLDSLYNIEWQNLYGGSNDEYPGNGIVEHEDGYFFTCITTSNDGDVSGFHGTPGNYSRRDIWAVRIDSIGDIIWQKCLGGSNDDFATDIFLDKDGGYVIFAETNSQDGNIINNYSWIGYKDIWMVKLNNVGDIIWSECYGGLMSEQISQGGVIKISDTNYIIAGLAEHSSGDVNHTLKGGADIWVFEIESPPLNIGINDHEISPNSISVSPNPAKNRFSISFITPFEKGVTTIELLDKFGRLINTHKVSRNNKQIDINVSDFEKGLYFVRVMSDGDIWGVKKVLVE